MKIEFSGDTENLRILESTVRELEGFELESNLQSHFQARLEIDEIAKKYNYDCELSYYDQDNRYLGSDELHLELKRSITGEPRVISERIQIPKGTDTAIARFVIRDNGIGDSKVLAVVAIVAFLFGALIF